MVAPLLVLVAGICVAGCKRTKEDTSVLVIIHYEPADFHIDQFRIAGHFVSDSSIAFNQGELPDTPRSSPFSSGRETALVLLSDDLVGQEIVVRVWGLHQGDVVAFGRSTTIPELGIMREVEITLDVPPNCGDGVVHPTEETCDTGLSWGEEGACPETTADCGDNDECTMDRVEGAGTCLALCFNEPITDCVHGDGCCPAGCGPSNDADCDAICGDGLVGVGETCDTGIPPADPGGCPTLCEPDGNPCTDDSLVGAGSCQANCPYAIITELFGGDQCCPPGGDATLDSDCQPVCGNGVLEPTEQCDVGIPVGSPGACPEDCLDPDPCVTGVLFDGGTCQASCVWEVQTLFLASDGCCPSGGNNNIDGDCPVTCGNGVVEAGEVCDTGIAAGSPGGCPASCDDSLPCTIDTVDNPGTCQASCSHSSITTCSDGDTCCPSGCGPGSDDDCTATCGDGLFEPASGELCDTAIVSGQPGACPEVADCEDGDSCTADSVVGAGSCQAQCANTPVACADGDGCCSPQCDATNDDDCSAICGNGVVEPSGGELCDTAITAGDPGSCPTSCSDGIACTEDLLVAPSTCAARCDFPPISSFMDDDGCCPSGGNNNVDNDCPVTCGNGAVEVGETCDTAIGQGDAGACPVAADCVDGVSCTTDTLINDGSCTADCVNNPISTCADGDGCCPAGCDLTNDNDCSVICGDGSVDGGETCDIAITSGQPGACPVLADCDDLDPCTTDTLVGDTTCEAYCDNTPVVCINGDGCCPSGCTNNTDDDCPAVCGNGLVESRAGEICDIAIASGSPGACPSLADCDDLDPCTVDTLQDGGTCQALCDNAAISTCSDGDGCCPPGCVAATDQDCGGCGNALVEPSYGEECDDGDSDNYNACSNSCTNNNGKEGDVCLSSDDCGGGLDCLDEPSYNLEGGYCADLTACDPAFPSLGCGPKGTCVPSLGGYLSPVCAYRCTALTDCRWADGYSCQVVGGGVSACLP